MPWARILARRREVIGLVLGENASPLRVFSPRSESASWDNGFATFAIEADDFKYFAGGVHLANTLTRFW